MAFTKALYYPWIDIRDESWLKSTALYWNQIQTIVPESIEHPYSSETALALQDAGILSPFRVRSQLKEIQEIVPDVIKYIKSEEGLQLLVGADRMTTNLTNQNFPESIKRLSRIHTEKMAFNIEHMLHDLGLSRPEKHGFLEVDNRLSEFYLTLLATKISENIGAGLLTHSPLPHNLSLKVKAGAAIPGILGERDEERMHKRYRVKIPKALGQGLLVELVMKKISLDPKTPIEKIIKFRRENSTELGRFRKKVGELTSSLPNDLPLSAVQQYTQDLYLNEVQPSLEDLKKSLTGSRIKWLTDSWMKIVLISAGSSTMLVGMGLATSNALLVGAGVSLVSRGIVYNVDKTETIRNNPYSYLVGLEKAFS